MKADGSQTNSIEEMKIVAPQQIDNRTTQWQEQSVRATGAELLSELRASLHRVLSEYRLKHYKEAMDGAQRIRSEYARLLNEPHKSEGIDPEQVHLLNAMTYAVSGRVNAALGNNEHAHAALGKAAELFDEWLPKLSSRTSGLEHSEYGLTLSMVGRVADAKTALEKAIELGYTTAETYAALGDIYKAESNYTRAEELFQKASVLAPEDPLLHISLGEIAETQGKRLEAINAYQQAIYILRRDQPLDTLKLLDRVLTLDPNDTLTLARKAEILRVLNRHEEGLTWIDQALALTIAPEKNVLAAQLRASKGQILNEMGRHEEAANVLQEATKLDPTMDWAYGELARSLDGLGRYEEALQAANQALAITPDYLIGLNYRWSALVRLGRYEEALQSLNRILAADLSSLVAPEAKDQIAEGRAQLLAAKAEILNRLTRIEEALEVSNEAVKLAPGDYNLWGAKGYFHLILGQYDDAIVAFERSLRINPNSELDYARLGEALRQKERYEEALQAFEKAPSLIAESASLSAIKGQVLHALGKHEEAVELLRYAVSKDEKMGWAYQELGATLNKLGRHAEALNALNVALILNPDDPRNQAQRASSLIALGKYPEALQALDEGLAHVPDNEEAWSSRHLLLRAKARLLQSTGKPRDSLSVLDAILAKAPEDAESISLKGAALLEIGQVNEAVEELKRAIELDPKQGSAFTSLNRAFYKGSGVGDDKVREINHVTERILAKDPKNAPALSTKGETLYLLKRYPEALQALDESLDLEPENAWTLGTKGQVLYALNEPEKAIEAFKRSLEIEPSWSWSRQQMIDIYTVLGRYEEALAGTEELLSRDAKNARAQRVKGDILFRQKKYPEALQALNESLDLEPDNAWGLGTKGQVLRALARNEEAIRELRRALEKDPDMKFVQEELINILFMQKLYEEALQIANQVLAKNPGDVYALLYKGDCLKALRRYEEALKAYERVQPRDGTIWAVIASTLQFLDDYDEALKALEEAALLEPENPEMLRTKASVLTDIAEYEQALQVANKALERDPASSWALVLKGLALEAQGRGLPREKALPLWQESKQCYLRAVELDKSYLSAHVRLGDVLYLLGEHEAKVAKFEWICTQEAEYPNLDADTVWVLGWARYRLERYDEAVQYFINAMSLDTRDPAYQLDLALTLLCNERYPIARRQYERALDLSSRKHRLGQRGVLDIAVKDLQEAINEKPNLAERAEAQQMLEMLRGALEKTETEEAFSSLQGASVGEG